MTTQPQRSSALVVFLITLLFVIVADIQILRNPLEPTNDQIYVASTFKQGYPDLASGITSHLIARSVNQVINADNVDRVKANTVNRVLAASVYLAAGGLLAWAAVKRNRVLGSTLFLLFLLTSRYPFTWLSSELFAGAFLMLYLWSLLTKQAFALRIFLLTLFAFAKPDLLLPGIAVALYDAISHVESDGRTVIRMSVMRIAGVVAIFALFALPGLLRDGMISSQGVGQRSLTSFSQHYAAVVQPHQIVPAPRPWAEEQIYIEGTFGSVSSVADAILAKPTLYMDFVFLSAATSVRNAIQNFMVLLLPLVLIYWSALQPKKLQWVIILLVITNLIPIMLLSFVHVRYMARFYPIALLVVFAGVFQDPTNTRIQKQWQRYAVYGYLALLLILQLFQALEIFQAGYWFLD